MGYVLALSPVPSGEPDEMHAEDGKKFAEAPDSVVRASTAALALTV